MLEIGEQRLSDSIGKKKICKAWLGIRHRLKNPSFHTRQMVAVQIYLDSRGMRLCSQSRNTELYVENCALGTKRKKELSNAPKIILGKSAAEKRRAGSSHAAEN